MHRRYEPSNIPIEILRSFVGILDSGSFTKAAARLNITQPAISAQIKRMQNMIGEELFQKDGVGIVLTEKGETVCRYARRILSLNDQILSSGRSEKRFRIGLPSILAAQYLGALKHALANENFQSVQIVCDRSDSLQKRLSAGLCDAAVVFSATETATTAAKAKWDEPLVWVCHPEFVLSPGAPLPLLSWPNSVPDQIAIKACEQANISYTTEFVGDQLNALMEGLQLKLGYLCIAERAVPAGMKIAKDYFLPKLPPMHAGIYKNIDVLDGRLDALVKCIARVFEPADVVAEVPPRRSETGGTAEMRPACASSKAVPQGYSARKAQDESETTRARPRPSQRHLA